MRQRKGVAASLGTAEQIPPGGASDSHRHTYESLLGKPAAFAPAAHHATHENGGADEINVGGLSGTLADPQTPDLTAHLAAADPHTQYQKESEKGIAAGYAGLDAGAHVPTAQLGTGAAGAGTKFLADDQTYKGVTATLPDLVVIKRSCTVNSVVPAGYAAYVPETYEVAAGITFEVEALAAFEVG